jgi:hypothetical protein
MAFPKNDWIRAVMADAQIDAAPRLVLVNIGYITASPDDGTFCVKQTTVAERLGVSLATVERAVRAAKRLRYIELVTERRRGPGSSGADKYRLMVPTQETRQDDGSSDIDPSQNGELPVTEPVMTRHRIDNDPSQPPRLTCENAVPKVFIEGFNKGLREGTASADAALPDLDPCPKEPERFCPEHRPNGTTRACPACGGHRKEHDGWKRRRTDWRQRQHARAEACIRVCNRCDEKGWLLGDDHAPVEPARKCDHQAA